jgi:hypothetical protein
MKMNYTPAQELIFFPKVKKKFTIVSKGRRAGLTRGAAQAFIEYSLKGNNRFLWGETIYSNVQRYIDLYFLPHLNELPSSVWEWKPKLMQLSIFKTVIDFRSADSPEMWEGFGYNKIFLNEAGIILKNPELYNKTVLPMLMDYADSELIAAGVPKGKKLKDGKPHPFFELWEKALSTPGYTRHRISSYDNPFLRPEDIHEIEDALDDKVALQEIHGEFIDSSDNPYLYTFDSGTHVSEDEYIPSERQPIWLSFDFNIEPNSCIVGQMPDQYSAKVFDEISVKGKTEEVCDVVIAKYSHWINRGLLFVTGDATGKNRNAMSGEVTNYKIIKQKLRLIDSQFKVRHTNMELKASRVLCNSILSKAEVSVTKNCKQTIIDCQVAEVDGGGELVKNSGLHKLDCFRYILEAWFPDFLDKGHKYIRPSSKKIVVTNPLATRLSQMQNLKTK